MTSTMTYTFLGDGTKVGARVLTITHSNGLNIMPMGRKGKSYRGSFVYNVSGSGVQTLESIAVSTGRLIALTGSNGAAAFESDAFFSDHLGNVAAVVSLSGRNETIIPSPSGRKLRLPVPTASLILEQNDYLPFGTRMALKEQPANRYRYAGKEEQDIAGMDLGLLDFGARYYDAFVGRWNAIDPLAHKYFGMSPYNYCGNDPVNMVDPDGRIVRPLGEDELEVIRNTLPIEARQFVQLDEDGNIDKDLLLKYSGESNNFLSLLEMVNSNTTIVFSLSDTFKNMNPAGLIKQDKLTYLGVDDYCKDTNVEFVSGLSTGETGNYGKTLFPDNEGEQNSPSGHIEIYIHPSLSALGKAETFSHEGYGHSLLYLRNGFNHNGASHQPVGMVDINSVLKNMIFTARKETITNFSK